MQTRARIVMAVGLVAVAALLVVVLWLDSQDWRKLLLFGGIVGVAAWGWGREAPAAAKHPVEEVLVDDTHAGEETAS